MDNHSTWKCRILLNMAARMKGNNFPRIPTHVRNDRTIHFRRLNEVSFFLSRTIMCYNKHAIEMRACILPMKRILKSPWLWIVVIAVAGFAWWKFGKPKPVEYTTETVVRGDVVEQVDITGNLSAESEINLDFETTGRINTSVTKVGANVAVGTVLATLENAELNQRLSQADAALDQALGQAGMEDDTIRQARREEENAKKYLDDIEDLEDQKVSSADKNYENALIYQDAAKAYYEKVKDDSGENSVGTKSAYVSYVSAKNATDSANESKQTARKSRDVSVRTASNTYKSAKEKVASLESNNKELVSNAAIQSARAGYQLALSALEKAKLKAPVNGVITKLNYKVGEVLGSARGQSFGKMISKDYILEANAPESDIVNLSLGQKALVTFDSTGSEEIFEAEILEIEPDATVIQDVVYYVVKFRLASSDSRLKPGMSADISVETSRKNNVLLVPRRAVREEDGKKFVDILTSESTPQKREVKTGIEDTEGRVEILSGLSEGDTLGVDNKSK